MGPIEAVQTAFLKYARFRGRASRAEYWWFMLFYMALWVGAVAADAQKVYSAYQSGQIVMDMRIASWWTPWVSILMFIPLHSISVRRLHDVGLSGWWMFGLLYLPAFLFPVAIIGGASQPVATAGGALIGLQILSALTSLVFFILMMWPTQRCDNRHGPGPYEHHPVGGANFMAGPNAAQGDRKAAPSTSAKHDPWAAYLQLDKADVYATPEGQAARKAEVNSLYRQKILGEKPADTLDDGQTA